MSLWNWLTRRRDDRGWPAYIINGRIRTSTVGLIVAFFVISWLHNTYQPPPAPPATQEPAQVVPPGFMPDPEYTWVPRTNVQEPKSTTSTTTTTTTEPSEELTPTDSTTPTTPTSPSGTAPVTVVDPDGPGPLPATTLSPSPTSTPTTIPTTPALNIPGLPPIPLPAPR